MPGPRRSRPPHAWLALFCVAVGLFVPASASADTPSSSECDARVNDTPGKLLPCIQKEDLQTHMENFWDIAVNNPGPDGHPSRNSGEPGYLASAEYVMNAMKDAGYDAWLQPYKFTYFAYLTKPSFSENSPEPGSFGLNEDWTPGASTGTTTGDVVPVGHTVIPASDTPSSASGCSPDDFAGVAGHVALIQRGTCTFGTKAINAQNAGATGVIIFNEGNPDRTDLFFGSMQDAAGNPVFPSIPVAFTPYAVGKAMYDDSQAGTPANVTLDINSIMDPNATDWNVIAESKGGDKNHVVVVDAHLDAIYGAGMLDNASGSATILDIAQKMKNVNPRNKLRFIWFGGEELGLLGSEHYVNSLSSNELSHIGYDLDADVTSTPNYIIGVLDPAAPDFFSRTVPATFPNRVYKASQVSRDQSVQYFDSIGKNHELLSPNGTDAFSFNEVGIPASGLLTGQDCCKSQEEVDLFGGHTGAYEGAGTVGAETGCVDNPFLWCDNLANNDFDVMTFMSKAFANTVVRMAFDTKVMSASNNLGYKPKLPIGGEVGRRFTVK
jgi:Peptidase family M28/PA domain